MNRQPQKDARWSVADFCATMESIAPTALAQSWDNVGLLAGDRQGPADHVLACIDLTPVVLQEALQEKTDVILAYHPPTLKPVSSICADGTGTEVLVFQCIRNGIAVYSVHTALDAADGGTNDAIASLCGIEETEALEYVDDPATDVCKLVVFVPPNAIKKVSEAMFSAGAGNIGEYSRCSYRTSGQGTFFGGEATRPTVGEPGRMEYVDEIRLEIVVPLTVLPAVVTAMVRAHPYEEPAFDVYPLKPPLVRGIGRIGRLPRPAHLATLARKLKRATDAVHVQIVGPPDRMVDRAVIVVGAAGSLPFRASLARNDVIITGEIRHHDALAVQRYGCIAIALGHWASERPVLAPLAQRLQAALPGITVTISQSDKNPFHSL